MVDEDCESCFPEATSEPLRGVWGFEIYDSNFHQTDCIRFLSHPCCLAKRTAWTSRVYWGIRSAAAFTAIGPETEPRVL